MSNDEKILLIDPRDIKEPTTLFLDEEQASWIRIEHLPDELKKYSLENFDVMFNEHPEQKGKIIFYKLEMEAHRYYQSYLNTPKLTKLDEIKCNSYMFSGYEPVEEEFPEWFKPFLHHLNKDKEQYNQCVVNWFEDGNDYLPFHKDWEYGKKDFSGVSSITIMKNDDDNYRIFEIKPLKKQLNNAIYSKVKIKTRHGVMITMEGDVQKKFLHGVPKMIGNTEKRISITFRNFNQ